jgi:hypothetical protein
MMKDYIVSSVCPQDDGGYVFQLEGGWGSICVGAFATDVLEPIAEVGDVMLLDHAEVGRVTRNVYNVTKAVLSRKI